MSIILLHNILYAYNILPASPEKLSRTTTQSGFLEMT